MKTKKPKNQKTSVVLFTALLTACGGKQEATGWVSDSGDSSTNTETAGQADTQNGYTNDTGVTTLVEIGADGSAIENRISIEPEEMERLIAEYEAKVALHYEEMFGSYEEEGARAEPKVLIDPNNDSRTHVSTPESYPESKHVFIFLQRPNIDVPRRTTPFVCSGTFIDETHVLTAAHCVFNRNNGHRVFANIDVSAKPQDLFTSYGVDKGVGYVCLGGDVTNIQDFQDNCEFVDKRWAASGWMDLSEPRDESDYAVIRLQTVNHPNGLGQGRWMAISSLNTEEDYTDRNVLIRQFPGSVHGSSNSTTYSDYVTDASISPSEYQSSYWRFTSYEQYLATGETTWRTTQNKLVYDADTTSGASGSGVFYFSDNSTTYTGQSHYLLGVHSGGYQSLLTRYNYGPSAHKFRTFAIVAMNYQ